MRLAKYVVDHNGLKLAAFLHLVHAVDYAIEKSRYEAAGTWTVSARPSDGGATICACFHGRDTFTEYGNKVAGKFQTPQA